MQMYLGIKAVEAKEMTRGDYNEYRGWEMPADEDAADTGYFVIYPDGYESWCPTEQFELANTLLADASFEEGVAVLRQFFGASEEQEQEALVPLKTQGGLGLADAISAMKAGQCVCRAGWNGKGMFLFYAGGMQQQVCSKSDAADFFPLGTDITVLPHIMMKIASQDAIIIPWLASQADLLSDDWEVL